LSASRRHLDFRFGSRQFTIPYNATYAATKAFANTFGESLRGELRKTGVHVTVLAPGRCAPNYLTRPRRRSLRNWCRTFCGSPPSTPQKKSLDALARNKMRVVPGVTSKAMSAASQYAPRAIVAPIVEASTRRWAADLPTAFAAAAEHVADDLGAQRLEEGLGSRGCSRID